MVRNRPLIVMVDDDPADVHALRHAFKSIGADIAFRAVDSGAELLQLMDTAKAKSDSDQPDLVFLDINMPGLNGFETLEKLRRRDDSRQIPVLIYSTSHDPGEVARAYELGANSYIVKPNSLVGLKQLAQRTSEYWFGAVSLSNKPPVVN